MVPTLLLGLLLTFTGAAQQEKSNSVRPLDPTKPVTQELNGGGSHKYELKVEAGQYVLLSVAQTGTNIALAVFDPAGKTISDADAYLAGTAEETSFIAGVPGTYRVEVRSPDKNAVPGQCLREITSL